jgi:hypothetical protein
MRAVPEAGDAASLFQSPDVSGFCFFDEFVEKYFVVLLNRCESLRI